MAGATMSTQAELDAAIAAEVSARNAAISAAVVPNVKLAGDIVQTVRTATGASSTTAVTIPLDDTVPTSSEGAEFMTASITPTSATNLLEIQITVFGAASAQGAMVAGLFQDAGAAAIAVGTEYLETANGMRSVTFSHRMTAGTTSATTFRVRVGATSGTFTFNGALGARYFGGVYASSITVREIKA